jgi:hypothetical protein
MGREQAATGTVEGNTAGSHPDRQQAAHGDLRTERTG